MAAFSYTLPVVGGSEDTWGTTLNANWTALGTFLGSLDSAELAVLDGITATTAELNIMDGVTATTTEINYLGGVTSAIQTQINAKAPSASPTLTGTVTMTGANATVKEVTETVYAVSGTTPALEPGNGTIQTWTLSGNSTPTDSFASGQSMTLMIAATSSTITWPTMTWVNNGGTYPALSASATTVVVLWKAGATLYGALIGDGT